jgi:hypothetical protein
LEPASDPWDRSDVSLSGTEIGATPADDVYPPETGRAALLQPARGLVRFIYSSNPFYILSADLVFVGLRISFGAGGPASRTCSLLLGLGGYTLLMATTACVLIRLGKLWDDLRSLLLLIVMMFLAMAMSGDDVMAADFTKGAFVCLGGFLFAVLVSEAVLRAIRLRLPGWYRVAYYLIIALVFLYPIALGPFLSQPESPRLQWLLFAFSPMAALALTPLVAAARAGAAFVARNGSPWRWPLFPWSLFVVMAIGLAVRCSTLCVSFHFVEGHDSIYGHYFLVPIGLAVSLIWFEIGIASCRRGVMAVASAVPLGLAFLAMTGHRHDPVYTQFLRLFMDCLGGSPAFLSLIAAIVFLIYALARRSPLAWELMSVGLVAISIVGPKTTDLSGLVSPRWPPILAGGLVLGFSAWRSHDSRCALIAAGLLVAGLTLGWATVYPHANLGVIAVHLIILAFLTVGAVFDDLVADAVRSIGALLLLLLGFVSATGYFKASDTFPAGLAECYPALVAAVAFGYGFLVHDYTYLETAFICLAAWLGRSGWLAYSQLRKAVAGLDQIVWGLVFFSLATAISLRKAGLRPGRMAKPLVRLFDFYQDAAWRVRRDARLRR